MVDTQTDFADRMIFSFFLFLKVIPYFVWSSRYHPKILHRGRGYACIIRFNVSISSHYFSKLQKKECI